MEVGARIKKARGEAKLTQRQLALSLGVDAMTISRWERDEYQPSIRSLSEIATLTGKPLPWFFGEVAA